MRILLIENDQRLVESLELLMARSGHALVSLDLGEDGITTAKMFDHDIILLAHHLPDMRGVKVIKELRHRRVNTPVIVLSADIDPTSIAEALNAGADDYIVRPFGAAELLARIQAVVRRAKGFAQNIVHLGPVSLNLDAQRVHVSGRELHLTGREWAMLQMLVMRRGSCVTKEMMLDNVYGGMDEPDLKIIDVFICKIRKKFAAVGVDSLIETIWGRGYMLREPDEAMPLAQAA